MKKIILTQILSLLTVSIIVAQAPPTAGGSANSDANFWTRAGNTNSPSGGNLFGTRYNSPLYFITGGGLAQHRRGKWNAVFTGTGNQYTINNYGWNETVNTSGYLLLGNSNTSMLDATNIYEVKGAFSMLHLNGEGSVYQEYGYRPWMKTGVTFTGNKDLTYMGLRKLSTNTSEEDITETVFLWSDNSNTDDGPDKLVFRFSGFGGSDGATVSSNRLSSTDLDALHVAQFTGTGLMGLGNTFGTNATGMSVANYIEPKSLLHMSYDWRAGVIYQPYGFAQITYRRDGTTTPGTGETANDGLRWGIDNAIITIDGIQHLNAYLRWQENTPFIVQTDWDNTPGGINNGERLRISSVSSPGVPNPGGVFPINTTRVAISHLGNVPITQPRSLLHLGYNTGIGLFPAGQANGWRSWMDIGTFTSNGTDHMYVGLKVEGTDRADAVINWGDNQATGAGGPDKLRFIFSSSVGQGDPVSQSQDGLETMRVVPIRDTLGTYGRVGIGDFTAQGVNEEPTHKIDVVGNGRFRYLPDSIYMADAAVDKYVMVDSMGVLRWLDAPNPGDNFAGECGDTVNGVLQANKKTELNDFNFYFEGNDPTNTDNNVGFGYPCGTPLKAKVDVYQQGTGAIGGNFLVTSNYQFGVSNVSPTGAIGVAGGDGDGTAGYIGLLGNATGTNAQYNYGVMGIGTTGATVNRGGYFVGDIETTGMLITSDEQFKINVEEIDSALTIINQIIPKIYHYDTLAYDQFNFGRKQQYGFIAQEFETVLPNLVQQGYHPGTMDSLGNMVKEAVEYKAVNYVGLIPILTKGMQEQQNQIDTLRESNEKLTTLVEDLNERLSRLESCLSGILPSLCEVSQSGIYENSPSSQEVLRNILNVELFDGENIVLNQNVPNPFAESTVITYSIPENVQKAQLHFYNMSGQLIKTVEITSRGAGRMNVFGSDLSTGTYTYTLVADGKIVDTKRMVKSN